MRLIWTKEEGEDRELQGDATGIREDAKYRVFAHESSIRLGLGLRNFDWVKVDVERQCISRVSCSTCGSDVTTTTTLGDCAGLDCRVLTNQEREFSKGMG